MELTRLRSVYKAEGPFATVYLEGRTPGEDAEKQMRLRWQALREGLEQAEEAPAAVLDELETSLLADKAGEEQANGRVLVANEAGVVLEEPWDAALGSGDQAYWSMLPQLGSYVRERTRAVRMLVVVADRNQAHIRRVVAAQQHDPRQMQSESVSGDAAEDVHKPRGGALSHNQIQRRAEETVKHNTKQIAERLRSIASTFRPRAILLASEVQARSALREVLAEPFSDLCIDTEGGMASEEALAEELGSLAQQLSERDSESTAEKLDKQLAHDGAVQGDPLVARAAEMGAVDTLLFEQSAPAAREAFLLKTCVETNSELALLPAGIGLPDGVAATLRFPLPQ